MPSPAALWKQAVLSILAVIAVVAFWQGQDRALRWLGYTETQAAEQNTRVRSDAVPVIVAPVGVANDDLTLEAVGTGRAQRSVTLRSESTGKITSMALAAGRHFAEGDVLVQLDDREQRLALELAETRLREAERALNRYQRLQGTGAASTVTVDEAGTATEIARLELERAREALTDQTIRAPFSGVSGLPVAEMGDWLDSGEEIASFDDREALLVEFELPEALLARIGNETSVSAATPAFPERSFAGRVVAIDSRVDPQSRAARVRVAIPNEDDLLRPGASFTIRLDLPGERYPIVPELAVEFSRGSLRVWRIANDQAELVEVELVRRRAGRVLVKGPLDEGDLVVVEGTQRMDPGRAVEVIDRIAAEDARGNV